MEFCYKSWPSFLLIRFSKDGTAAKQERSELYSELDDRLRYQGLVRLVCQGRKNHGNLWIRSEKFQQIGRPCSEIQTSLTKRLIP